MTTVAIAMSGGVDSSVAAALLVEQGYKVIGIMTTLWSDFACETENRCCTPESLADAQRIAQKLGIPFYAIDTKKIFKNTVVNYFLDEYVRGLTPNPCLICNRDIRWNFLLEEAQALGATHLATGHYAIVTENAEGKYLLQKGKDPSKDQSYMLAFLSQAQLKQTIFPLGNYTKVEVREIAKRFGLSVASKPDSQDLCFLGASDYRDFLKRHATESINPGTIVNTAGKKLGTHEGLAFYTIGQRKGIGVASPEPVYVIAKDLKNNLLVVGNRDELGQKSFSVHKLHWHGSLVPGNSYPCMVKTRYKSQPLHAILTPQTPDAGIVTLETPQRDISPGQGAVFYDDDVVIGAGFICYNSN